MLQIGKKAWAAVDSDGKIVGTSESDLIHEDLDTLKFEMKAWGKEDYEIKRVRIVLVDGG